MKNLHKKQLRLSRRGFWLVCALLVCLRLALTGFQQAYTWVGGAPLDDELMFRAAQNITAGEWLGAYDYLTLSKAMFFPVWLALLHALHLPYLVAGAALWCGAARAGPCTDAGAVCGAGVSAVVLGGLHAARLPRQHLPGTLPVLFCGHGRDGTAGRL